MRVSIVSRGRGGAPCCPRCAWDEAAPLVGGSGWKMPKLPIDICPRKGMHAFFFYYYYYYYYYYY